MVLAEVETRRNGTGVAMPIKTAEIEFEDIGYAGWHATVRTNPRAAVFDEFLSTDPELFWHALSAVVVGWNFADEDGQPLPLPKDGLEQKALPYELLNHLVRQYIAAVNAAAAVPKAPDVNSEITSEISGGGPRNK